MTTATASPVAAEIQAKILNYWPRLSTPKVAQLADTALELAGGDADLALAAVQQIAREARGEPTRPGLRRAVDFVLRAATVARRVDEERLRREYERQRSEAIDRLRCAVREWTHQTPDAEVVRTADALRERVAGDPFGVMLFDMQAQRVPADLDRASRARALLTRTLLLYDLEALLVERGALEASPVIAMDFDAWRREWSS